jgi:hypothetical protein
LGEVFPDFFVGSTDTVTNPDFSSTDQTKVDPGVAPSSSATASGTVVRTDLDPPCTRRIADRKVPGKILSSSTDEIPVNKRSLYKRQPVAHIVKYPRGYRLSVALSRRGRKQGVQDELIGEEAELRFSRAKVIASHPEWIEKVAPTVWFVASSSGTGRHKVELDGEFRRCDCKDFVRRSGNVCKHLWAVWIRETQPEQASPVKRPRKQYPQNTPAYDRAQKAEMRLLPKLLRDLVALVPEPQRPEGAPGRPRTPLQEEIYCAVMKVYSGFSSRRSHGLRELGVERGQLSRAPSFMVCSRLLLRPEVTPILYDLLRESARPVLPIEEGAAVAPDSTGVQTTSFGAWREYRHREKRTHSWVKLHLIAGLRTHVILNAVVDTVHSGDSPQFETLLRGAIAGGYKPGFLVADAGYLSERNYDLASELEIPAYIKFKSNSTNRTSAGGHTRAWRAAFYKFAAHREEFDVNYHKRSNVESVMSALKRKLGENIRSRDGVAQVNEVICKTIAYNLTVVIHEMFEHGIEGEFERKKRSPSG